MILIGPSPEQEHPDNEASDCIAEVKANWPSRKEKAIAASEHSGQTSSPHFAKDLKVK